MDDKIEDKETEIKKKTSTVENLGKFGIEVGKKLGNVFTEFFTGKPLTEEEKEDRMKRKAHLRKVKQIQREAEERQEIELAKRGQYKPPESKKVVKKDGGFDIFKNLGKHNPLDDFNQNRSLGSDTFGVEAYSRIKSIKPLDLELEQYEGNPLDPIRRR